jgi:hypothetical protein
MAASAEVLREQVQQTPFQLVLDYTMDSEAIMGRQISLALRHELQRVLRKEGKPSRYQ